MMKVGFRHMILKRERQYGGNGCFRDEFEIWERESWRLGEYFDGRHYGIKY